MNEKVTIQIEIPINAFHALCFHLGSELTEEMKKKLLEKPCQVDIAKFDDEKTTMEMALACLAIGSIAE